MTFDDAHRPSYYLYGRPVVVFDLDGCLRQNPYHDESTKTFAPHFNWGDHWREPGVACHEELVDLARSLLAAGHSVLVLTARPDDFHEVTIEWLKRVGPWEVTYHNDRKHHGATGHDTVHLMMLPRQIDLLHHVSGAEWKRDVVRSLIERGIDIRFVVEDYKPNADVIREVVPVLLYERKKGTVPAPSTR